MNIVKEKKGFTLIELLAVIVILAIVAVIGYSTVLPLLEKARKNAFATQANNIIDAAQTAFTAYNLGLDTGSTPTKLYSSGDKYCYIVNGQISTSAANGGSGKNLHELGTLTKALNSDWSGYVLIQRSGEIYQYTLYLTNDKYNVSGVSQADADSVGVGRSGTIESACPNS